MTARPMVMPLEAVADISGDADVMARRVDVASNHVDDSFFCAVHVTMTRTEQASAKSERSFRSPSPCTQMLRAAEISGMQLEDGRGRPPPLALRASTAVACVVSRLRRTGRRDSLRVMVTRLPTSSCDVGETAGVFVGSPPPLANASYGETDFACRD